MRIYLLLTLVLAITPSALGCVTKGSSTPTSPTSTCTGSDQFYDPVSVTVNGKDAVPGSTLYENDTLKIEGHAEAVSSQGIGIAYIREDDGKVYLPGVVRAYGCPSFFGTSNVLTSRNGVYILGRGGHVVNLEVIFAPTELHRSLTWDDVTNHHLIGKIVVN